MAHVFFLKGRGPLDRGGKRGGRKERLTTQAKMHMGLRLSALVTTPSERPQNYRNSHLGIAHYGMCAGVDKGMGDVFMTVHM